MTWFKTFRENAKGKMAAECRSNETREAGKDFKEKGIKDSNSGENGI